MRMARILPMRLMLSLLCCISISSGTRAATDNPEVDAKTAQEEAPSNNNQNSNQCTGGDDADRTWSADMQTWLELTEALPPAADAEAAYTLAEIVLADRDFGATDTVTGWDWQWRFKPALTPPEKNGDATFLKKLGEWLQQLSALLGNLGNVLLWALLLVALLWIWRRRDALLALLPGHRKTADEWIGDIHITPLLTSDALPADVVAAARQLWQRDHRREALGLLYRSALQRLGARFAFTIPASCTEQECLILVRRYATAQSTQAFQPLLDAWMRCAWANQQPDALEPLLGHYHAILGGTDSRAEAQPENPVAFNAGNAP